MNKPTLERSVIAEGLAQAVLVGTGGLFDGKPDRGAPAAPPPVAGMPVILRSALTLQRAGIRELIVLANEADEEMKALLRDDPRVKVVVRWMPVREFPLEDPRTWETLGAAITGTCLVAGGGTVFPAALVETLREELREGRGTLLVSGGQEASGVPADLVALPGAVLRQAGAAAGDEGVSPLEAVVQRAAAGNAARTIRLAGDRRLWCATVRDRDAAIAAERRILDNPDKELDGYVDRYVNRVLARPLTRAFLALGLSPNLVTLLSIGIGLVSALCFAIGSYAAGLAGALLLQVTAVVDCCDGDVARATFSESDFGAHLDLIGDNVVHMAVFGGIAWGLAVTRPEGLPAWLPPGLGAAAIFGTAMSVVLVRRVKRMLQGSVPVDARREARSRFLLKNIASRDFTLVVLLFAVFDALPWFLGFTAVGVNAFWIVMAWCARPPVTARA